MSRTLEIGSTILTDLAIAELSQSYTPLRSRTVSRFANGSAVVREAWAGKLATDLQGGGPIPSGLLGLDFSAAMTLKCVGEYAIGPQTSNVFVGVTANRRSDTGAAPYGRALVGGQWVLTPVTWGTGGDVNKATLTTVGSASVYQLIIYPSFSAIVDPPTQEWDWNTGDYTWSLHAEEA
jgi:hypothetical protein